MSVVVDLSCSVYERPQMTKLATSEIHDAAVEMVRT